MKIEKDLDQLKYLLSVFNMSRIRIGNTIIDKSDIQSQITQLEEKIAFINQIKAHEELVLGNFNLSKHFELHCWLDENEGEFNVSLEVSDELNTFLYNNFISSNSGIREWAEVHFCHVYDFLSGNSKYNFAFGTTSFKYILEELSKTKDVTKIILKLDTIKKYFAAEENKHIVVALDAILDSAQEMAL